MRRRPDSAAWRLAALLVIVVASPLTALRAQETESAEVVRALDLEASGKYREAATLFRGAVRTAPTPNALLGLERVYAELGMSDSLLAPLDTLIARHPREPLYRSVQLRTLQLLRRDDRLRDAFDRWVLDVPRDPTPYREYARLLLQQGRSAAADTVLARARAALGRTRDMEYETAQLRAAKGEWVASAESWRRAVADAPHLATAAAFALAPTPSAVRDSVRSALALPPAERGARRAIAELEMNWGRPREAWEALRTLPRDTASATMWEEFGDRALEEERWTIAREALVAAVDVRYGVSLALRAARASLHSGMPADVFRLIPLGNVDHDPALAAREFVPLHVDAFAALAKPREADALVARFDRWLAPAQRMRLAQAVATAWVRSGDLVRARAALHAAGPEADSSEAAGWLALYEGRLAAARVMLRSAREATPELALALGIVARARGDSAASIGEAFLALARGDSLMASARFVEAARAHPEVAPALLLAASRLHGARIDAAIAIWRRIVVEYVGTPEAVESELEWARALRRSGDSAGAASHLEHLILSAPQSALLPQARRELEQARGGVPPE